MSERSIPTESMRVRPKFIDVVRYLRGLYTLYLDVGGTAKEVLGVDPASNVLVVSGTPTSTRDMNACIEVLADGLQNGEQLRIYGVETTATVTGKLFS